MTSLLHSLMMSTSPPVSAQQGFTEIISEEADFEALFVDSFGNVVDGLIADDAISNQLPDRLLDRESVVTATLETPETELSMPAERAVPDQTVVLSSETGQISRHDTQTEAWQESDVSGSSWQVVHHQNDIPAADGADEFGLERPADLVPKPNASTESLRVAPAVMANDTTLQKGDLILSPEPGRRSAPPASRQTVVAPDIETNTESALVPADAPTKKATPAIERAFSMSPSPVPVATAASDNVPLPRSQVVKLDATHPMPVSQDTVPPISSEQASVKAPIAPAPIAMAKNGNWLKTHGEAHIEMVAHSKKTARREPAADGPARAASVATKPDLPSPPIASAQMQVLQNTPERHLALEEKPIGKPLFDLPIGEVAARPFSTAIMGTAANATPQNVAMPQHIGQQIAAALDNKQRNEIEIRLEPEELGKVRIVLSGKEGAMTVLVFAEKPETLELMRRNSGELAAGMSEAGFDGADLQFERGQTESAASDKPSVGTHEDDLDPQIATSAHRSTIPSASDSLDLRL